MFQFTKHFSRVPLLSLTSPPVALEKLSPACLPKVTVKLTHTNRLQRTRQLTTPLPRIDFT